MGWTYFVFVLYATQQQWGKKSLIHILCQWSQSLGSNLHRAKFACSTTTAKPCVQAGLLPVPRRHTMLVCGIYFIKSLHQDKNAQVDRAQQLQLCDKTMQSHWCCATAHSTNAHLGTYPGSSVRMTACSLLQCAWEKETEQRHKRRVVKYRVWWVGGSLTECTLGCEAWQWSLAL